MTVSQSIYHKGHLRFLMWWLFFWKLVLYSHKYIYFCLGPFLDTEDRLAMPAFHEVSPRHNCWPPGPSVIPGHDGAATKLQLAIVFKNLVLETKTTHDDQLWPLVCPLMSLGKDVSKYIEFSDLDMDLNFQLHGEDCSV